MISTLNQFHGKTWTCNFIKLRSVQPIQLSWDTATASWRPQMFLAHSRTVPEASQCRNSFAKTLKIAQGSLCRTHSRIHSSKGCLICMRGLAVCEIFLLNIELNYLPLKNTAQSEQIIQILVLFPFPTESNGHFYCISKVRFKNSPHLNPNSTRHQLWIIKGLSKGTIIFEQKLFSILKSASNALICRVLYCSTARVTCQKHHSSQYKAQKLQISLYVYFKDYLTCKWHMKVKRAMMLTQYLFHVLIIQGFCRFQVSLCSFNFIPLRPQDPQIVLKVKGKEK